MRYLIFTACLALGVVLSPASVQADTPIASVSAPSALPAEIADSAKPELPRAYRDFHKDHSVSLTFLDVKNMHREVNAIFTDNWEIPSTTATKSAGLVQLGDASHMARVTAYWPGEPNDPYTTMHLASTGVHLHSGHCAVDPRVIPYGSVVQISGVGIFLAVDTGSAVISRQAAKASARTPEEASALVIDLYFDKESDGQHFAAHGPAYAAISWWAPDATGDEAKLARSLVAGEEWTRIYGRQVASARL